MSCVFHSQSDVLNKADEMGRYCGTDWRRWDIFTNSESSVSIAGQRQTGCRLQFGPRSFRRTSIVAETVYRRSKRSRAKIDAGNFHVWYTASQADINIGSISVWHRVNSVGWSDLASESQCSAKMGICRCRWICRRCIRRRWSWMNTLQKYWMTTIAKCIRPKWNVFYRIWH